MPTFGPSQVIGIIDELLDGSQRDLETGRQCVGYVSAFFSSASPYRVEATLQQFRNNTPAVAWLFDGLLNVVRGNVSKELEWANALRASRSKIMQLPPDTDVFTIAAELIDNTPEVQALAATFEGWYSMPFQHVARSLSLSPGPLAVANALSKLGGALFFCWAFALLTPADAYQLWNWPDEASFATWLGWTAPCVGASVLLVAMQQLDDTQAVHPLPQADERAMSYTLVTRLGLPGSLAVAGGAALAAGLVFRGAWLNLLTTTVFAPPDTSAMLDPDLAEAAVMRSSFGTLLPAAPSLPVPPILLLVGAVSSVAVLETLHRLVSALLSDAQVQQGDDETSDPGQTEVLNENNEWVSVSYVEGGDEDTVTVAASVRVSCVAAQWALCAALCAETLATQSLFMSVGTHAACMLATALALKAVADDDDGDEQAPATPEPAAARRDAR